MIYLIAHGGYSKADQNDISYDLGDTGRYDIILDTVKKLFHDEYKILIGCGISSRTFLPGNEDVVIKNYLVSNGIPEEKIIVNPKGWSTITEIISVYKIADLKDGDSIIAFSSWYHLPRVWIIWKILFGISPRLKAARPFEKYDWRIFIREPLAILKSLFLLTFKQERILQKKALRM